MAWGVILIIFGTTKTNGSRLPKGVVEDGLGIVLVKAGILAFQVILGCRIAAPQILEKLMHIICFQNRDDKLMNKEVGVFF